MTGSHHVLATVSVDNLSQGVQITSIDLEGESETEQFGKRGTYKLVRVDDE